MDISKQVSQGPYWLVHDTETTGFPSGKVSNTDPEQSVVVQHAAILFDSKTFREVGTLEFIIDNGVFIKDFLVDIHGVSTELAKNVGVTPFMAYSAFLALAEKADGRVVVAHNAKFDKDMTAIMLDRAGLGQENVFQEMQHLCTMELAAPWCKIPPTAKQLKAGFTGFKNPNLSEALYALTGQNHDGAHNAMNDVRACIAILRRICELREAGITAEDYQPIQPAGSAE